MQQAQRAYDNPALNFAINKANELKLPLITLFVITSEFPDANLRHYTFMLQGISETSSTLAELNIEFVIIAGNMVESVINISRDAALLITDKGYLRIQRSWRAEVAQKVKCRMTEIESDVMFPVEMVMQKEAYNAKSFRTRIYRFLPFYNITPEYPVRVNIKAKLHQDKLRNTSLAEINNLSHHNPDLFTQTDTTVAPSKYYRGGYREAKTHLRYFIDNILDCYFDNRNNPAVDCQSNLSSYLHFGQISIREFLYEVILALELEPEEFFELVLSTRPGLHKDKRINGALVLFEEAVVRRELSMNYCHFNDDYDQYYALPDWARLTLREHSSDIRPYLYGPDALEQAETHDIYWNAAQKEMVTTGKMHGYMRMYWGKKILEWCQDPEDAFRIALYLNNKYELDGRDPNGFAGVAWCFGKHDRAWSVFPVFGKVRIMKAEGLKRKFDMNNYINRIEQL